MGRCWGLGFKRALCVSVCVSIFCLLFCIHNDVARHSCTMSWSTFGNNLVSGHQSAGQLCWTKLFVT